MTKPAASSPEVVVRVSGFVKCYKQHLAVDRLDLTVKRVKSMASSDRMVRARAV